jgi:hypothetical protein
MTPNDILIKAMEMAFNAGMDIINLSLGENGGWSEDPLSIIADRIAETGINGRLDNWCRKLSQLLTRLRQLSLLVGTPVLVECF